MAIDRDCLVGSLNPKRLFDLFKYKVRFAMEHPDFFYPCGIEMFCGPQGAGKTLSSVLYVYKLLEKYPKAKLITNLILTDFPIVSFDEFKNNKINNLNDEELKEFYKKLLNLELFDFKEFYSLYKSDASFLEEIKEYLLKLKSPELIIDTEFYNDVVDKIFYYYYLLENRVFLFLNNDDFLKYKNGEYGIIYLVDEIQLYLSSLESKNINIDIITQLSQQRKQRSHIVCTSQIFGKMAKPLREQFSEVIYCKNLFDCIQVNYLIDRNSIDGENSGDTNLSGKVIKKYVSFHSPDDFNKYDTYSVIQKGKFVSGEDVLNIYDNLNDNENKR